MFQIQLINTVINWEKRLELEDEKRKNHRFEPYVNFLAKVQPCRKEHQFILARIFRPHRDQQSVPCCYVQEQRREMQPS